MYGVMILRSLALALTLVAPLAGRAQMASAPAAASTKQAGVLPAAQAEALLPNAILYKGQLAPVQARNAGAIRLADGTLIVASLIDNSGYSSGVRERFQFFLYTERPLRFGAKTLPPGCYGAGFLADNTMAVMDVGNHDLFTAATSNDPAMKRPRPLQIVAGPGAGEFRLYLGRAYIALVPGE